MTDKSKEQRAEEFVASLEQEIEDCPYGDTTNKVKQLVAFAYLAGYEAGRPKWVSVKDKPPMPNEEVIIFFDNGHECITTGFLYEQAPGTDLCWYSYSQDKVGIFVTNWMLLPEKPEGEAK